MTKGLLAWTTNYARSRERITFRTLISDRRELGVITEAGGKFSKSPFQSQVTQVDIIR